jgi:hypothetical protein
MRRAILLVPMLVFSLNSVVVRAEEPASHKAPVPRSALWLEPELSLGPYHWRATSRYTSFDAEERSPEMKHAFGVTRLGGAAGLTLGRWLGDHIAVGATVRTLVVEGAEALARRTQLQSIIEAELSVLVAEQRTRGVRARLSAGGGALATELSAEALLELSGLPVGPAAGVELGYAFPVGRHAFVLGLGLEFSMVSSQSDGDHGTYHDRNYVWMPGATTRFVL